VITGELADGFSSATDVLVGTGTESSDASVVADVADFLTSTYLVARDGVITDGFDTAIIVTTDGSTVAFSDAAAAQAATAFDVTVASGATVILGANNDTATGTTGNETITGGAGVDTLDGGAVNDTFIIGTSHDGTAESYTGGDGVADKLDVNAAANLSNDTLATIEILDLDASGTAVAVTMTDAQVDMLTSITSAASAIGTGDKITLSAAMTSDMLDGTVIGGSDDDEIIFILADAANALTLVDASMGASDKLYIDGSAGGASNALTFIGTAEDDAAVLTVKGGAAEDTIMGGDGADVITGGTGADILTGDAGVDFFVYADQDAAVGTVQIANSGGSALTALATSTTTAVIAAGDTFTGLEVITDLDSTDSSGEKITLGNASVALNASVLALANNKAIVVQGTYGSDVFTVGTSGTTGADSVIIWDGDNGGTVAWNAIVLQGVDSTDEAVYAISSGDFIA
jgi:Ca2+-binding RTX toxin-like protein